MKDRIILDMNDDRDWHNFFDLHFPGPNPLGPTRRYFIERG
jgi:hypothetical protein